MKLRCWLLIKILLLATMGCVRLLADVAFDNFTANLLLNATNAQVKIVNRANILGFSGESIVEDFGHNSPSNWAEAYANNDKIGMSGGTDVVSTDLVTSNSFFNAYVLSASAGPGSSTGSVDGRIYPRFQTTPHYFPAGTSMVQGFVYLGGGFFLAPQAVAVMDTVQTVSGPIDLGSTGLLVLNNDLYLTHNITLTSGGYIKGNAANYGQANTIFMGGDLTLASDNYGKVLHITGDWANNGQSGDLIIDGCGHTLNIGSKAQIFVDQNVTLTLRNMTIKTGPASLMNPAIQLASLGSKLALDNVMFDLGADFNFKQGQLFIHNEVAVTGTSAFVYTSPKPSYITSGATWSFETGTTFSIAPATYTDQSFTAGTATSNNFIVLADQSSALSLNNCSLKTTFTGARFTKGMVLFDNKVALDTQAGSDISTITLGGFLLGASVTVTNLKISPDGRYAASGYLSSLPVLQLYRFNGTASLSYITSSPIIGTAAIPAVGWSPDGKFIAAGSDLGLYIYRFNGTTLTQVGSTQSFGLIVNSISWSPDGKYLAVGGNNGTTPLIIYRFDGTTLTQVTTANPDSASIQVNGVAWSPDGKYLATTGRKTTANPAYLQVYMFNGTTLSSILFDQRTANGCSVGWSQDSRFMAWGLQGTVSTGIVFIYQFNGTGSIALLPTITLGVQVNAVSFSPDGRYLLVCGANGATGIYGLYRVDRSGATLVGSTNPLGNVLTTAGWSPDGKYAFVGGTNTGTPSQAVAGFSVTTISTPATTQGFSNGLLFGDKAKGSDFDANVNVLGGSAVTVKGMVSDDSV
jgi:WD40 repeat protein